MAAVNSVTAGSTRLPLAGFPAPRAAVLMCSAAMGAEGSVTLQLREAEGPADAAALGFGGVLARLQDDSDADLLADMLGTLHAAEGGGTASFGILEACPDQELAILGSPAEPEQASSTAEATVATTTTTETARIQAAKRPRPKAVSPTRQGPQQCQMCSKVFGNASALAKHKLTHSDERKYVCTMCAKAFKRQDHLNGHMLTHRNKKPYECKAEGCGKSYCDARSLRRHRENHHGSSTATDGSNGNQNVSGGTNVNHNNSSSNAENAAASPSATSSLSPSTASGDASSPHGSSCIQYAASPSPSGHRTGSVHRSSTNHTHSRNNSTNSTAISAGAGNEGLTTQQLELISQIMQQTKQQSLQQQNISRSNKPPRTWNMQTQLQQSQKKTNNVTSSAAVTSSNLTTVKITSSSNVANAHSTINDGNKSATVDHVEPKPVECNLCHRKFKNIPALNGHMRLHGGYFKKDSDSKKTDKKESALPPLQTASQSVRALIEEKIISRQQRGTITTQTTTTTSPQQVQHIARQQVQQIISRSSDFVVPATPPRRSSEGEAQYTEPTTTNTNTGKDATLIELLKRGTKLQVKRSLSDSGASSSVQLSLQPTNTTNSNVTTGEVFTLAYQNPSTGGTNTFYTAGDEVYVQDTAMLLQAVNSIQLLQQETDSEEQETLQDIASLEDYAAVSADLDVQSPEGFSTTTGCGTTGSLFAPVTRELRAVLDSPLPEGLAELGAYQDPSHSPKDLAAYQKEYLMYTGSPPSPLRYPCDSPGLGYPTPPASHETQASQHSLDLQQQQQHTLDLQQELQQHVTLDQQQQNSLDQHSLELERHSLNSLERNIEQQQRCFSLEEARQSSSPLSAAFFTATMSSAEEVEEALETVLPGEMDVYDPQSPLQMSYLQTAQQMMMPNSDDPLLSSSPKDFAGRKKFEFINRSQRYSYAESETKVDDSNSYMCETVSRSRKRPRSLDIWPGDADTDPSEVSSCYRKVYCSRLKAGLSGPLHFTPSPMLDPDRSGIGLYKQLASGMPQNNADLGETAEPMINIGTAYQASIPECSALREMDDPIREHLLWDPGITSEPDQQVERYLRFCSAPSLSLEGGVLGEEQALLELLRRSGNTTAAKASIMRSGAAKSAFGVGETTVWSRQEVDAFQAGVMRWRKDFSAISREIGTKTVGQCVAFYYIWKKVAGEYKLYFPTQNVARQEEPMSTVHSTVSSSGVSAVVDARPHHCEMPDCSASFSSRAALHGHTRIHCSGAGGNSAVVAASSANTSNTSNSCTATMTGTSLLQQQLTAHDPAADEYPCRICGKVFIKVKSRSAHMKSHRPVEATDTNRSGNKNSTAVPRSPAPALPMT